MFVYINKRIKLVKLSSIFCIPVLWHESSLDDTCPRLLFWFIVSFVTWVFGSAFSVLIGSFVYVWLFSTFSTWSFPRGRDCIERLLLPHNIIFSLKKKIPSPVFSTCSDRAAQEKHQRSLSRPLQTLPYWPWGPAMSLSQPLPHLFSSCYLPPLFDLGVLWPQDLGPVLGLGRPPRCTWLLFSPDSPISNAPFQTPFSSRQSPHPLLSHLAMPSSRAAGPLARPQWVRTRSINGKGINQRKRGRWRENHCPPWPPQIRWWGWCTARVAPPSWLHVFVHHGSNLSSCFIWLWAYKLVAIDVRCFCMFFHLSLYMFFLFHLNCCK